MKINRLKLSNKITQLSLRIISWLADVTNVTSQTHISCKRLAEKIIKVINTRGISSGINYSKSLRLTFLETMLSMQHEKINLKRSSHIPRILKEAIRSSNKDQCSYPGYRLIYTALYITRYLRLPLDMSFNTITERSSKEVSPDYINERLIKRFLKELGNNSKFFGKKPKSLNFKEYHQTSKSGPSGHALWTSFYDAHNLTESQIESISYVGGDRLKNLIESYKSLTLKIPGFFMARCSRKGDMVTRKLTGIKDKEGKTRVVAIMDYFTQAALLPLHNYLYKQLQRIDQDCTHNQSKLIGKLVPDIGSSYHSIDLTAATDRFPIKVQQAILSVWFGDEYAKHWANLMVGYPFHYNGKEYSYTVGNPMGAYSSFNSFSISHHYLVFLSCHLANRRWKKCPYMLLGDDIVIANDDVAKWYKTLLKEWGVPYNETKTHSSYHGYEFAKQTIIHNNINVSPFPISALLDRSKQAMLAIGIIYQECLNKEWNFHQRDSLYSFLVSVLGWSYPRVRAIKNDIDMRMSLIDFLNGRGTLGTSIRAYVVHRSDKSSKLPDKAFDQLGHMISQNVIYEIYQENKSRVFDKSNPKPLGQLATEMVMAITSTRDGGMDCFDLIESVPFLQIYGRAEELIIKLMKPDIRISFGMSISPAEFKEAYSKVNIPLSDEGFYVRHRDVLMTVSNKVSKIMKSELNKYPRIFDPLPHHISDPQLGWYYN